MKSTVNDLDTRIAIWNVTAKQVTLITSNSWISRNIVPWSCLRPARTFEIKWKDLIYTRRGFGSADEK